MLNASGSVQQITMGPVSVRLSGIVRTTADGGKASLNEPDSAEALAALNRAAKVAGADGVVNAGSEYHRHRIASGPLSTQTVVVVQAWGTAVRADFVEPPVETDTDRERDAD